MILLACGLLLSNLVVISSGSDPAPDDLGTNTTKPLTRAQVLAMTPDETDAGLITSDAGFQACNSGKLSSAECQQAMTKMLASMTQTHRDVAMDLGNVNTQLQAIDAQQAEGINKINAINRAIYGDGSDSNPGLMNSLQKVALALGDIQNTVRSQAADISNKSATVRAATETKINNVKKVMDVKLQQVEQQINDLLTQQATAQQQTLVNANNNMVQAAQNAQGAISANNQAIGASSRVLLDAVETFRQGASNDIQGISVRAGASVSNLKTLSDAAEEDLENLGTQMKTEAKSAVNDALASSRATLGATVNSTSSSLNDIRTQALAALQDANKALGSEISQTQAEIDASIQTTKVQMAQMTDTGQKGLSSFSSMADAGVAALQAAQQASGQQMAADAQATQTELNDVSNLVNNYQKTGLDAIAAIEAKANSLQGPMQSQVSDRLAKQGQASGQELLRINSAIGDLLNRISADGGDAMNTLSAYIGDVQSRAGDDAKFQQDTLSDTQSAIKTASELAKGRLKLQSDKADSTLSGLATILGGSIDDAASTLADVNAANSAKQRSIQSQYQQQITDQESALNRQVNEAKMSQQQGFQDLQSKQAQKAQNIAALIAQLMGVLDNVNTAAQASSSDLSSLEGKLASAQSSTDSDVQRLLKLIEGSESAANAGASGAQAKLQFALSAMGDQLSGSLKNYASQFNGDLSSAIASLTQMSDDTLAKLSASGAIQTNASADAEAQAKKLLTDIQNLMTSGQASNDALGNLFRSQATQQGLSRQIALKQIMDGAQGQISDLGTKAAAMIDQQSKGLAASTGQQVANQADALNQLVATLRSQQLSATQLASNTQSAVQNVQKWINDLSSQIDSAQSKVSSSKTAQLNVIQALQNELNDWSATVDKNISDAKQQLQDGMAMIPNVTATKAEETERIFATSNENMRAYLGQLKAAFDKMRATESQYVQQQSLRRLSTLMGIDRASLDNSNVLMQLLGVTDLSQIGDQQQIATVLAGLADGVSELQKKNDGAYAALKDQVDHLDSNSKGLFSQLMNKAGGSLAAVYQKYADDQHALQATIEAAADKDRLRAQALEDALNGMMGSIRNGSLVLNTQLAKDRKDIYTVDGAVRQLGDESTIALSRLLHAVESQSDSADSAIALAQRVNADRVASVRDVVMSFVRAMQEYVDGSRSGFDDIHEKLQDYKAFLDQKLGVSDSFMLGMAQSTQSELSATSRLAEALQNRIEAFNARAKQQLFQVEEERSAIEARHERELNLLKQKLVNVTRQVDDDQATMSKQVDSWLAEEDVDLGFGGSERSSKTSASSHAMDAGEMVASPNTPDWAREDEESSFPKTSFIESKPINKHEAILRDIKSNLRRIHEESRQIGITV
jgi:hypothetical protein